MHNLIKIITLSFILALWSCSKEERNNISNSRYSLIQLESNIPLDLNFDGEDNTNLLLEVKEAISNIFLYNNEQHSFIDIIWVEPQINNNLLAPLPSVYSDDLTIKYQPVSRKYYYKYDKNEHSINITNPLVSDYTQNYTFQFPKYITMTHGGKELYFKTRQMFLTKKGIEDVELNVSFKENTD
ncbi:MAG TPA: hypothetical protein DDZ96_02860 [Porphyromonadaceae bacterium]|jgi:hypothetical protein|nr:hypothetical protein [Porphyromonadaceae bacterium]HBX19789.1 hypothetical protein [Porphyromonadaceae bacterium]HCM19426.1 hypothetical protein [Porphyromonadaceae bacterium]